MYDSGTVQAADSLTNTCETLIAPRLLVQWIAWHVHERVLRSILGGMGEGDGGDMRVGTSGK